MVDQERATAMNALVNVGPGIKPVVKGPLTDPVCIRVIGGLLNYNAGTDEMIDPPEPVWRLDVLVKTETGFEQRNIELNCERKVTPQGARIGHDLWLIEPAHREDGIRSVSMLVDRSELVAKLRALADVIEALS